jgi:uncharacterized protein (TIGR03086 family)
MTWELPASVELLERALGYTRARLAGVTPARLGAPTPCAEWDLHDLLEHMDDALDAFLEAAGGVVALRSRPVDAAAADTVSRVQLKACALVGVWTAAAGEGRVTIVVGGRPVPSGLLVSTAALEVTVHGWDVGWATGAPERIPRALARDLLPVAAATVSAADRGIRFAAPRRVTPDAPPDHSLLAHLGRAARPAGQIGGIRLPGTGAAS